ncbi:endocuticle structural glycoprotein ABD-4-like [Hetaerina americana]|uniref:endocuticle structural glycoprotein ABD-4-like n=1 Tax=Hetaerina americana TaxID=62018 RepID=UPI003A7F535F
MVLRLASLAIFLVVVVAATSAQVLTNRPVIPIVQHDEFRDDSGQFSYRYITGDGATFAETGKLVPNDEGDGNVLVKEGSYTYTSPEDDSIAGLRPGGVCHCPTTVPHHHAQDTANVPHQSR